jgi:hypothetical protein
MDDDPKDYTLCNTSVRRRVYAVQNFKSIGSGRGVETAFLIDCNETQNCKTELWRITGG